MAQNKENSDLATIDRQKMSPSDNSTRLDLSPAYQALIRESDAEQDKRTSQNANIIEGVVPKWHVLEVFAGTEDDTVEWLAERGFGVYLPLFYIKSIVRGRLSSRRRKLIPGYVFIFVWDIEKHRARIMSCETVIKIMKDGDRAAEVKRADILKLRATEQFLDQYVYNAKKRRRRRRNRRNLDFYSQLQDIKIETLLC